MVEIKGEMEGADMEVTYINRSGYTSNRLATIGTRDEQNKAHRAHQDKERTANISDHSFFHKYQIDTTICVRFTILLGQPCRNSFQFCLRRFDRDTRFYPAHSGSMAVVSIQIERRPVLKRYPDLDIIPGELKSFRHDADHGEQFIIQRKLLADDIRIPTESSLPEDSATRH